MSKTKIYCAVPSIGTVSDLHPYVFRQLERDYGDRVELHFPENCTHRKMHDFARNEMVKDFLESDCDILWFLDSDVVPPPHILDLVTEYGDQWELAGAPYPVFMTPSGYSGPQVVMCVYTADEFGLHASQVPQSGVKFVDGLATGCLFIKRSVFEQLEAPYFEFKFDEKSKQLTEGEDLGFCRKVNDLGYKFFTDFGMCCKHYKTVDLLEVNNYAISYANTAVESYHAQVRPKVEALSEKYRALLSEKKQAQASGPRRTNSGLILPD